MPLHPYTEALLSAVPIPKASAKTRRRVILKGDVPSLINRPAGCHFHTRCTPTPPHPAAARKPPAPSEVVPGHWAACHLHDAGVKPRWGRQRRGRAKWPVMVPRSD